MAREAMGVAMHGDGRFRVTQATARTVVYGDRAGALVARMPHPADCAIGPSDPRQDRDGRRFMTDPGINRSDFATGLAIAPSSMTKIRKDAARRLLRSLPPRPLTNRS